jgi:hypothetical protein
VANKAYISLVPTGAQTLDEFRPISVITGVIKIISKILAPLHEIFSENQTANIRRGRLATYIVGRNITETFLQGNNSPLSLLKRESFP